MQINPITVEVIRNAINAYADEMAIALCKSAYNMMIFEVRDFCCGLLDAEGGMISQNKGGLPIFLADLGIAVKDGIQRYGLDGFQLGDVIIMNHGQVCGQHLNNVAVYAPCFHNGKVVAFAANRAHWADIGGTRLGFGSVATTDIFQEGLQFRSIKAYEGGKRNETLWQIIHDNLRFPEAALGDLRAQVASCQLGIRRYTELLGRYGQETTEAAIHTIWDIAEKETQAFVEKLPDGTYEAETLLDNDGRNLDKRLRIKIRVIINGAKMVVDFSDINEQVPGPMNSGYSGGLAAARVAFKYLTQPRAPVNEGSFRALEVILPEGKIVNAKPPAAIGLWSVALPTVVETILKTLADVLPDRIPAGHKGDMGGCSMSGFREDNGRRFLLMNIFGGGWGGRPYEDGVSGAVSICQGDVRNAPVELQEIQYPVRAERFELRQDSGGAGKFRGGLGVDLTYIALQKAIANVNCERTSDPPYGLHGGHPGMPNRGVLRRHGSNAEQVLLKSTDVVLHAGDRLSFQTGGGGGWGDPRDRKREDIERDILDGYISLEAARHDYGYEPL